MIQQSEHAEPAGVLDTNSERAAEAASNHGCPVLTSLEDLAARADAAVVASPTITHASRNVSPLFDIPIIPPKAIPNAIVNTSPSPTRIRVIES